MPSATIVKEIATKRKLSDYNSIIKELEIISKFPEKIKELSGDPYDDILMESFSKYIEESKKTIESDAVLVAVDLNRYSNVLFSISFIFFTVFFSRKYFFITPLSLPFFFYYFVVVS